jgi:hypothetical protein
MMKRSAGMTRTALLVLLLAVAACGGNAPTTPAVVNVLTLVSISPAAGTKLTAGSSVNVNGTLVYMLATAGSALVSLVFEDQNNRVLNPTSQPTSVVPGGQGEINLAGQLAVPVSGVTEIQVIYTLTPNTNVPPIPTTATVTYPVGP